MRRAIGLTAALVAAAALLTGSPAGAQKKEKANPDLDKDKDANSEKMIKAGVLTGKVANIYEDKRVLRLTVNVPLQKVNTGSLQSLQNAQRDLAMARARGDRNGMLSAQKAMAQAQASLVTVEYKTQHVELTVQDDAVVRTAWPKGDFDEKGKLKKLTKAELKELKGPDPKVPGYKADFSDVATEQVVRVTLVKKKQTGPAKAVRPKPKAKGKGKDDDPDAAADLLGDNLPQVSMIVILAEAPPGG
jgi:hypothetical protein